MPCRPHTGLNLAKLLPEIDVAIGKRVGIPTELTPHGRGMNGELRGNLLAFVITELVVGGVRA